MAVAMVVSKRRTHAERAGAATRQQAQVAVHDHAYLLRPGRRSGWRWWLERGDGARLATSGRPAGTREQARIDTLRVRLAAASAAAETFRDEQGRYRWRLLSRAGTPLAVSAVGYASGPAAGQAVAGFRRAASHAELDDG